MSPKNWFLVSSAVLLALLLPSCGGGGSTPTPTPTPTNLVLNNLVSGLTHPLGLEKPPGDARLFVVEQPGTIRIIENGALLSGNFLDIHSLVNFDGAEQGLLGMAFHPNYSTNRKFYVNYTRDTPTRQTVIAEFQASAADPDQADPASERDLLVVNQPFTNHKGGQLVFGADGFLYIGLGDGGGSGGAAAGQRTELVYIAGENAPHRSGCSLHGEPAVRDSTGQSFRGRWRIAGDLCVWAAQPLALHAGARGQPHIRGRCRRIKLGRNRHLAEWRKLRLEHHGGRPLLQPTHRLRHEQQDSADREYPHTDGIAVIGGYVYKGTAIPSLANKYIFADLPARY